MKLLMQSTTLITLLLVTAASAQTKSDNCRISAYWQGHKGGLRSGLMVFGHFQASVVDKPTIKTFTLPGSSLVVNVGVEYAFKDNDSKRQPITMRLAIVKAEKAEQDPFETVDNAEAEVMYRKNWEIMSVSKKIKQDEFVYTVALVCEEGGKK